MASVDKLMTKDCCVTDETFKKTEERNVFTRSFFDIHRSPSKKKKFFEEKLDHQVLCKYDLETKPALDVNIFYQARIMRASSGNIAKTCSIPNRTRCMKKVDLQSETTFLCCYKVPFFYRSQILFFMKCEQDAILDAIAEKRENTVSCVSAK